MTEVEGLTEYSAPLTWNSLPPAVLNCDSLSLLLNPDLKLICFLMLSDNFCSASASVAA